MKKCCEEELIFLYARVLTFAQIGQQVIGEKNDYYIKLWQLEGLIKAIQDGDFEKSNKIKN